MFRSFLELTTWRTGVLKKQSNTPLPKEHPMNRTEITEIVASIEHALGGGTPAAELSADYAIEVVGFQPAGRDQPTNGC
jgi:hypothetical protein